MKKFLCLITILFTALCIYANGLPIDFTVEDDILNCVGPGDIIIYTVMYNSLEGPPGRQDSQIFCTLDPYLTFLSATGPYTQLGNQITWLFDSWNPFTETITCQVMGGVPNNSILRLAADLNSAGEPYYAEEITEVCYEWDINDPNVKWVQHPDPIGWDVMATYPIILADDWLCNQAGLIKDIHFWGSWFNNLMLYEGEYYFHLSIYDDIPADESTTGYSMPGLELWNYDALPGSFTVTPQPETYQGWYDPYIPPPPQLPPIPQEQWNHNMWFQYDVILPQQNWFFQEGTLNTPLVYWLSISLLNVPGAHIDLPPMWGWKSSVDHWNDDGVSGITDFTPPPFPPYPIIPNPYFFITEVWNEMIYADGTSMDLAFVLTGSPDILPVELSSFTGTFNADLYSSTLNWTTQSESANMGWNIYRALSGNLNDALRLNADLIAGAGNSSEPVSYQYDDVTDLEYDSDYWYWLESVDSSGGTQPFGPIIVSTLLQEEDPDPPPLADQYGLWQNYPNPFNPDTEISFILEKDGECELVIYDTKGRLVKILFQGFVEAEQNYSFIWRGRDYNDKEVTSGIYFYKIKSGRYSSTRKMILLK